MKESVIEIEGIILSSLPNAFFKVRLENETEMVCHVSGRIRKNAINILPGDRVVVTISPYDLTKGRITYRIKG
jgi:translation initiation factor IF-1